MTGERFMKKRFFVKIKKGLFFNTIISMTLEGYIEFLVFSVLNF